MKAKVMHFLKIYWYRAILWLAGIRFIYKSFFAADTAESAIQQEVITVESGSLQRTIKVVGNTKLINTQKLTFVQNGKVKSVNVKEWDYVLPGQLLAQLDTTSIDADIKQQQLNRSNAQLNYEKLFLELTPSEKEKLTQQVKTSQRDGERAYDQLALLTDEKERKRSAQEDLIEELQWKREVLEKQRLATQQDVEYTQAREQQTLNGSDASLRWTLTNTVLQASSALSQWDDLAKTVSEALGLAEGYAQTVYGERDTSIVGEVKLYLSALQWSLENLKSSLPASADLLDQTWGIALVEKTQLTAIAGANLATRMLRLLDVSVSSSTLSSSQMDALRAEVSSQQSKMISLWSSLVNLRTQIETAEDPSLTKLSTDSTVKQKEASLQSNEQELLQLTNDLKQAQADLAALIADYDVKIKQQQDSIDQLQWTLQVNTLSAQDALDWPRIQDQQLQQNSISLYDVMLNEAQYKLQEYELRAEFSGFVRAVDVKVGDSVEAHGDWIQVENPWLFEIYVLLDQIDIVKVKEGGDVSLVFDAYPGEAFSWRVVLIDPTPVEDAGVVSYQAHIVVSNFEYRVYDQMTVTVTIPVESRLNVVVIPTLAIQFSGSSTTVQLVKNGKTIDQPVQLGLTDGLMTEVVEWVSVGDQIMTKTFRLTEKAWGFKFGPWGGGWSSTGNNENQNRQNLQRLQ